MFLATLTARIMAKVRGCNTEMGVSKEKYREN
jgi:hypothetical protein